MRAVVAPELELRLVTGAAGIRAVEFRPDYRSPGQEVADDHVLLEGVRQLRAYFGGELRHFDLPLDPQGTEFQRRVWMKLLTIPYGETRSYAEIAGAVGSPKAVRAVGAANGSNPIAIVIPCHRVIGSNGKLTGYGGGLPLKQRLLALERGAGLFD